jgi:hypothetical protein
MPKGVSEGGPPYPGDGTLNVGAGSATREPSPAAPAVARAGAPTEHATQHPAALLHGAGHLVVYGNPPFRALFGVGCFGLPAAEALLDLPRAAFELMDLVYREGRPLARWITVRDATWRLTIADRRDIDTGKVYGIALHLVPRERGDLVPRERGLVPRERGDSEG